LKDSPTIEKFIRGQCLIAPLHPPSPLLTQLLRVLRALSLFIISRYRKHSQNITDPRLGEVRHCSCQGFQLTPRSSWKVKCLQEGQISSAIPTAMHPYFSLLFRLTVSVPLYNLFA